MMIMAIEVPDNEDGAALGGFGGGKPSVTFRMVFCSDFWQRPARDGDCQIYQ